VTRNWLSHGSSHVAASECVRAMQSLMDLLDIISPAVLPSASDADAVLASIQSHITRVEVALPAEADLSVELHTCLVFMRALQQLRVCARARLPPRTHDGDNDGDIATIIDEILKKCKPEQQLLCSMVLKGRHYMFHGADTRMTLPLLQSACAVSLLLRFFGAPAAAADSCDARAMQLMARMGISDVKSCVAEAVSGHSDTYVRALPSPP